LSLKRSIHFYASRPIFHIPFDAGLCRELNVERFELEKTGKILSNHSEGAHFDRFWDFAVYASEQAEPPPSKAITKTM